MPAARVPRPARRRKAGWEPDMSDETSRNPQHPHNQQQDAGGTGNSAGRNVPPARHGRGERAEKPERSEKTSKLERTEAKLQSKDITPVLRGWDYESGTINVRKITGA